MKINSPYIRLIVIALCLLVSAACGAFGSSFKGEEVKPLAAAPDFNLPDQNGKPFHLSEQQGHITLVFFGFTNCVDECPATMAHIKLALGMIDGSADQVRVVLISTDPVRDGQMALQDFLGRFDSSYTGITGQPADLQKIWNDYGVVVLDGGETHSSIVYVVDQQGNLRLRIPADTTPEDMASDLKILLASK